MRINPFYVLCFFVAVFTLTLLVYPTRRELAELYLASGDIQRSKDIIDKAVAEDGSDYPLLITAAEVYHLLGKPEQAIDFLLKARPLKPRNVAMLNSLATYYQWNMQPLLAMPVYEEILAADPGRTDILRTLVSHYRYYGMPDKESLALARLIQLESTTATKTALAIRSVLREELLGLAGLRLAGDYDPLRDLLMQQLFVVSENLEEELRDGATVSTEEYTTYCLEHFMRTGMVQQGGQFATRLDTLQGGVAARLRLAQVLQWNNLLPEAVAYLKDVDHQVPRNEEVLVALSRAARDAEDMQTVEYALESLTNAVPDKTEYAEQLAEVYLANNQVDKALNLFDRLLATAVDTLRILGRMLTAALFSGEPSTMRLALEKALPFPTDRPDIVETKVELHLALNEPEKAYVLLREAADKNTPDHEQLVRLLDVAAATGQPPLVVDAVRLALGREPDNVDFMRAGADALLTVSEPAEAYRLLKKIATATRLEPDTLTMLEAAGYTGTPATVEEAATLAATLHPASRTVMDTAAEVLLWVENPVKALPYAVKAARLSKGDREQVMRMVEIASFTGDPTRFLEALRIAGTLRPDDEDLAMTSAQALAAQGDASAFESLLSRFMRSGKDVALLRRWATMAEEAGLVEQAFRLWYQIYRADTTDTNLGRKVARLAFDTGHYTIAAQTWTRLADASRNDFEAASGAGAAWAAAGDTAKALRYFEQALAIRPQDRPTMLEVARNALYTGKYERSVDMYESYGLASLEENDRFALAEAYGNTGKAAKALEFFGPLLDRDPLPKDRALLITRLFNLAGQRQRAEKLYPRLTRAYGDDSTFLANLGAEAFFAEHLPPALAIFNKLLETEPENATALKGSAMVYAEQGNTRAAIERFRMFNSRYPDDGDAHFRLAELYTRTGRTELALREYKTAARLLKGVLRPPDASGPSGTFGPSGKSGKSDSTDNNRTTRVKALQPQGPEAPRSTQ